MAEAHRIAGKLMSMQRVTRLAAGAAAIAVAVALGGAGAGADTLDGYYSTDPTTGQTSYVDPDVGKTYYVDPSSGYYLDPLTGLYNDPATGNEYELDTTTGQMTEVDPANLHTGDGASGSCPTGVTGTSPCTGLINGEVTLVGPNNFSVYLTSQSSSLTNPLLLILAVPNETVAGSLDPGVVDSGELYSKFGTSHQADQGAVTITPGVTSAVADLFDLNTTGFFQATMTSGDVYHNIGPDLKTDRSFNMTNLTGAESLIFHEPTSAFTSFGIYVYSIASSLSSSISGKGLIDFASNLPEGTFVLSLGCSSSTTAPCPMNSTYSTPFTQAGLAGIYFLPEPGSWALLASCLGGFGFVWWRRRRHGAGDEACADAVEG